MLPLPPSRIHNKPVSPLWEWTAVPSVPVTAKAMLPSTSAVNIELAYGVKRITCVNTVRRAGGGGGLLTSDGW